MFPVLKGIPKIISPDLLKALSEIGHGNELVIYANILLKKGMVQ